MIAAYAALAFGFVTLHFPTPTIYSIVFFAGLTIAVVVVLILDWNQTN